MMKQWTLFPTVLQRKFLLTLLAGIASAGISVIICVATKDHILLALGIVIDSHGIEVTLLLSKSALLKIGEPYRFYFQKGARPAVGNDYLDAALSTNSFLGYEAISEPEEHPDLSSES